jgi:MYXO-CTERM domain-containing protein
MTWAQLGSVLPAGLIVDTSDRAKSDGKRIYVSGTLGPPSHGGVLERSDDGGATWTELPIPGADDMHVPYIAAIDPQDADVVYVRIAGPWCADPQDTLVVSKDGGSTWSAPIFSTRDGGNLLGFALSPDGSTVLVGSAPIVEQQCGSGSDASGLWKAPASTLVFQKVSSLSTGCLSWTSGSLYACASEFKDDFTAGISTDVGASFTPILHLGGVCPLTCGPETTVNAPCPSACVPSGPCCATLWQQGTASLIQAQPCTGAGSSGSTGGGGPPPSPAKSGCGCATPGSDRAAAFAGAAFALLGLAAQARRRSTRLPAESGETPKPPSPRRSRS